MVLALLRHPCRRMLMRRFVSHVDWQSKQIFVSYNEASYRNPRPHDVQPASCTRTITQGASRGESTIGRLISENV